MSAALWALVGFALSSGLWGVTVKVLVARWQPDGSGGADVHVACYDTAGSPQDALFVVQYVV